MNETQRLQLEKLRLMQALEKEYDNLPHLVAHQFYVWQRAYFECTDKLCLITAANQIGKSSIQIKKCIEWATNQKLWESLWPGRRPRMFWYLYPTKEVATVEWKTKWLPLMPKDKDHPLYGWKEKIVNGKIDSVEFNSGIMLVFKVYSQDVSHLQTGTCDAIFCDEEMPADLYEELMFRLSASDGYFSMVFTATLGQEFWRQAMEPNTADGEEERLPQARKWQISMYDCQRYEDGSPSPWTDKKIAQVIARCGTHDEVLRRVYGRFIKSSGRVYPSFDASQHLKEPHPVPTGWKLYAGIDSGSGGEENDPAAIVLLAVDPTFRKSRVIKAWRGDDVVTTSSDIINKYLEMSKGLKIDVAYYDYSDKDLHTIAGRMGIAFTKADKGIATGTNTVNTLFKNNMLALYREADILKLAQELATLSIGQRHPVDHLADALRYVCAKIPWDFSFLMVEADEKPKEAPVRQDERWRGDEGNHRDEAEYSIEDEIEEWNQYY